MMNNIARVIPGLAADMVQMRRKAADPAKPDPICIHVEDRYLSGQRMSLPFRRRDGGVVMGVFSPVVIAKQRPLGDTLGLLPFIYSQSRPRAVRVTGNWNRLVAPLCPGIEFDP